MPSSFWLTYLPVKGGSVAALRRTSYWSGSSCARHSWSVLATVSVLSMSLLSNLLTHTLRRSRAPTRSPSAARGTLPTCAPSPLPNEAVAYPQAEEPIVPDPRYVFITGGVVSSLGKGIAAASIGRLLVARGLTVGLQKFDPYINVDPGTMSPYQHGEVFVTEDGAETDLDLGHYERFTNTNT